MLSATRSTAVRSRLPFAWLGVPTQMSDMSVPAMAAATSLVALRRPAATPAATRSARPSSTMGLCPALIISTFSSLTSTPRTVAPRSARHAADTDPT